MSVQWIEHKGRRILFTDHRGATQKELIDDFEQAVKLIQEVPPPTKIRYLADFEGAMIDTAVMTKLKELGREVYEPRTEKSAVVGIHGIRHILLAAYNRVTGSGKNQKLFDTQEEALDWLVSD